MHFAHDEQRSRWKLDRIGKLCDEYGHRPQAVGRPLTIERWEKLAAFGTRRSAGRLRALSAIRVLTHAGHKTETFTCAPAKASSWCTDSEMATTACLLALYGAMYGAATSPATDAVFTR